MVTSGANWRVPWAEHVHCLAVVPPWVVCPDSAEMAVMVGTRAAG
ncbi:hypothetical protein [Nocardia inohanensis]|nr:hypothetical protein [Nocardia inohanensis]